MSGRYDLLSQLPDLYASAPFGELQRVLGAALARAGADLDLTMAQLWPQTARDWGLELWETAYGIPVESGKDTEFRRTRVFSKLRGQGAPTAELLKAVAAAFVNGDVDIVEHNDQAYFVVKFVSTLGIPPNIDDLTDAIREMKPAHLDFVYEYIYRTWLQVKSHIWGALESVTWKEIKEGDLI